MTTPARPRIGAVHQAGELGGLGALGFVGAYYAARLDPSMTPEVQSAVAVLITAGAAWFASRLRDWRAEQRALPPVAMLFLVLVLAVGCASWKQLTPQGRFDVMKASYVEVVETANVYVQSLAATPPVSDENRTVILAVRDAVRVGNETMANAERQFADGNYDRATRYVRVAIGTVNAALPIILRETLE